MNLQYRKELLVRLGNYIESNNEPWQAAKHKAFLENKWFIPEFINLATQNIVQNFLTPQKLDDFINTYQLPQQNPGPKKVGIVMAGNIPLVGFHDFLCVFITGHHAVIKPSSKDETLIKHLIAQLISWEPAVADAVEIKEIIKKCDAYIATGSNNTGRYFEYYFSKYPHIIRKNRTSVAILYGNETPKQLEQLADDVYMYFGLGCRNVTKLYVPQGYNFEALLEAFRKYDYLANHDKYKNNYDYNLAIYILNNRYYMTNGSILMVEDASPFSPISQLNFEYYNAMEEVEQTLANNEAIQCVVGKNNTQFGQAQTPHLCDFADNVDTMNFLKNL